MFDKILNLRYCKNFSIFKSVIGVIANREIKISKFKISLTRLSKLYFFSIISIFLINLVNLGFK